jgi:transglutaminase-like putative cysteine protease
MQLRVGFEMSDQYAQPTPMMLALSIHPSRAADQIAVEDVPAPTPIFLLGSRFCETEPLPDIAWQQFTSVPAGRSRVQSICDFVHRHIEFGYPHARSTRTAMEAYSERRSVCRDYAHLRLPCAVA